MQTLRRYTGLLAVYLFGFIPAYGFLGVLEGGARGFWSLSAHDWVYQGSAFLVQAGGPFIGAAVFAIPASAWATRRFVAGHGIGAAIAAAAIAAASVFLGTALFVDPRILFGFPFTFLISTAAYGLVVLRAVRHTGLVSPAT